MLGLDDDICDPSPHCIKPRDVRCIKHLSDKPNDLSELEYFRAGSTVLKCRRWGLRQLRRALVPRYELEEEKKG
jgi:hypothetical protein